MKEKFSPEIEKFLDETFDPFNLFRLGGEPKPKRTRKPPRTVTLSADIYARLKDYAARHNQSMSNVVNFKLDITLPAAEDEAEIDMIIARSKSNPKLAEATSQILDEARKKVQDAAAMLPELVN